MSIRVRRLRLVGISQNYDVGFVAAGLPRSLSVIAGEISTGKTSILEFIDYCLGASYHPRHPELQRQARAALLEVDLSGDIAVIERPLFTPHAAVFVHQCSIEDLDRPHGKVRRLIAPPGDPQSLSTLLLEQCGLAGVSLREAPTRPDSPTDPLSFRDVMWLCFLPNHRLDSRQLLHEAAHVQHLKLRQVIEVVFGIHDDQLAKLGDALTTARERVRALEAEVGALETFLSEQDVPSREDLRTSVQTLTTEAASIGSQLERVTGQMRATSSFADELRAQYTVSQRQAGEAAARVRDRETLMRRLLPLRGQYAEDEKKLVFYQEARTLFDPLRIRICPSCLQPLKEGSTISDGHCSLCGQDVVSGPDTVDVSAELTALRLRQRELDKYVA
jgi:hypothetical protein